MYVSNVFGNGHTQPWGGTVWLIPDAADATAQGTVTVDLSAALAAVGRVLVNYGWAPITTTYWLDTIAYGMEFGPHSADPYGNGPANFSLDLTSYCLLVKTSVERRDLLIRYVIGTRVTVPSGASVHPELVATSQRNPSRSVK